MCCDDGAVCRRCRKAVCKLLDQIAEFDLSSGPPTAAQLQQLQMRAKVIRYFCCPSDDDGPIPLP